MPVITQNLSAHIEVLFAVAFSADEQCFYAWSPQLRCLRDGDSETEALTMCREAVEVLVEGLLERGSLAARLTELGYKVEQRNTESLIECTVQDGYLFNAAMLESLDVPLQGQLPSLVKQTLVFAPGTPRV